jgi:hypothetical protein
MRFAHDYLKLGHSPASVEMAIARKKALQQFPPTLGNERPRPTLPELQQLKYEIMSANWCHRDSWQDVELKLGELQCRDDVYAEWEPYCPDHPIERKRNFKCFIQHIVQHQWMRRNVKVLFLDSTHGTNNYGLQLFIGATQVDGGLAIPLFFFMCTVDKNQQYQLQNGLEWMLDCLHKEHPQFCPSAIIMDHDLSEHNAVAAHLIKRAQDALSKLSRELESSSISFEVPSMSRSAWPSHVVFAPNLEAVEHDSTYLDCVEALEKHRRASQVYDSAYSEQLLKFDLPKVIPPKPSSAEYTELLKSEVGILLAQLQSLQVNMHAHIKQEETWAEFVDWAEKFTCRHDNGHGLVAEFCTSYLRTVKLLCEFHTKKSWTEKLNGSLKNKPDRKPIYRFVVRMMRKVTNWSEFAERVHEFVDKWAAKYPDIVEYFSRYYFSPKWRRHWARAGRMFRHNEAETTLPLERINGTLKYVLMKGIINKRPGAVIDMLVGTLADPSSLADNLVKFYERRLQDVESGVADTRQRSFERSTADQFESLKFGFERGAVVCTRVDEWLGAWEVKDGATTYKCFPFTTFCECKSKLSACAHMRLVDWVQNNKLSRGDERRLDCEHVPENEIEHENEMQDVVEDSDMHVDEGEQDAQMQHTVDSAWQDVAGSEFSMYAAANACMQSLSNLAKNQQHLPLPKQAEIAQALMTFPSTLAGMEAELAMAAPKPPRDSHAISGYFKDHKQRVAPKQTGSGRGVLKRPSRRRFKLLNCYDDAKSSDASEGEDGEELLDVL